MDNLYNKLIREELANDIIALAEDYDNEQQYLDDFANFGKAVQERLVTFGLDWSPSDE